MHLRNWCHLVIAKTSNVMYRLNVQVAAYKDDKPSLIYRGVVRLCDPLKLWGSNHITGTVLNLKSSNFVHM